MRKKMSLLFAGLGLCASMMMFSAQDARATKEYDDTGINCRCKADGCYAGNRLSFRPFCGAGDCAGASSGVCK